MRSPGEFSLMVEEEDGRQESGHDQMPVGGALPCLGAILLVRRPFVRSRTLAWLGVDGGRGMRVGRPDEPDAISFGRRRDESFDRGKEKDDTKV